jgi:hypothetical protein
MWQLEGHDVTLVTYTMRDGYMKASEYTEQLTFKMLSIVMCCQLKHIVAYTHTHTHTHTYTHTHIHARAHTHMHTHHTHTYKVSYMCTNIIYIYILTDITTY